MLDLIDRTEVEKRYVDIIRREQKINVSDAIKTLSKKVGRSKRAGSHLSSIKASTSEETERR